MALNRKETERYSRQLLMPNFGLEGQERLKSSRVLVIGAGGLGCPVLEYLVGAGVGVIGIVDGDMVSFNNLHRQILYSENDLGKLKAECASRILKEKNSTVKFNIYPFFLSTSNALDLSSQYDILVDCTDNFASRYLINDLAVLNGLPVVYGSVHQFEGQVSVFNLKTDQGFSPNYRDLFPVPPAAGTVQDCAEGGVLGVLPGIIGSLQALEVIKIITRLGDSLAGQLLLFDALDNTYRKIKFKPSIPTIEINELIDYEQFCGVSQNTRSALEVSSKQARELIEKEGWILVDIRETAERELSTIGGIHVVQSDVKTYLERYNMQSNILFYCRTGRRSLALVEEIKDSLSVEALSLKGGLLAYIDFWDLDLLKY